MNRSAGKLIDFHNHIWIMDDPNGDQLIEAMDAMCIERMVVHACPIDIWSYTGDNDDVVRAVRRHADRLIGTMHVDLRQGVAQCVELVRRYAGLGLRGVKMFPCLGFYPDDPAYYPVYEAIAEEGLFVAYHLGYLAPNDTGRRIPMSSKYAQPFFLEEIAALFPDTNFVICHMGGSPGYEQTLCVLRYFPNIYADTAPGHGIEAFKHMGSLIDTVAWSKIVFGTDAGSSDWAAQIEFWQRHAAECGYSEHLGALLYGNARDFLDTLSAKAS